MRTMILALLLATAALAGDTNKFQPSRVFYPTVSTNNHGVRVVSSPPLIDASKAESITNGITFGQVVTNLGPGWSPVFDETGVIRWYFSDGRQLHSWPDNNADTVLTTNVNSNARFWFTTNANILPRK